MLGLLGYLQYLASLGGTVNNKSVFTTGEVANLIHIHQTTVIDWVDKGILPSYKTPGGHRRISRDNLLSFLANHDMPVPHILNHESSNSPDDEAHRHLHEGYQIGPKKKPMDAYPPLPKNGGVRNTKKKSRLTKKS
jgi:excisionase family DNA binding protein